VDDAAWGALTLSLTILGGLYTWFAFRSRGFVAGLRGAGLTVIPVALLLTDTLEMVTKIGSAVGDWAVHLAFSPVNWIGILLAVLSVGCFVTAGFLSERGVGVAKGEAKAEAKGDRKALPRGKGQKADPVLADVDPEMAEIEALLRKRGIS
jgi:hypothetical protein